MSAKRLRSQGAEVVEGGVRYRTWCRHEHVALLVVDADQKLLRTLDLQGEGDGYFSAIDERGAAGDRYFYRFGDSRGWPDPASRFQPFGVHGPSMVVDPAAFAWTDAGFMRPAYANLVIYELHIGTFTSEGTFRAAIARLDHVAEVGANAIEIMPVADFPGERNWGYDGVALFAPARAYGWPADLRALVDAAHERGLAVILDVVYNHLGPDGNYLGVYHSEYFNSDHKTPWGDGLNFEHPAVRELFAENAPYWQHEFHIDGFRLDATHAIQDGSPRHILAEISERVHKTGGFLVAEDERNEPKLLQPVRENGLGFDGVWSDDFHHVGHVMLTGEREGYYANFEGTPAELAETLQHGWLFRGQPRDEDGKSRGAACDDLAPESFVYCISNHDQVGNRAFGERLGHTIGAPAYRAASALLCLVPYTPMLFMGQEWSASSPFQFFTDHNLELGKLVTQGRRKEFRHFAAFRDPAILRTIPDPQAGSTFAASKLRWDELEIPRCAQVLQLYREFLHLRRTHEAFRDLSRTKWKVQQLGDSIVSLEFGLESAARLLVLVDLVGGHAAPDLSATELTWKPLLSSNEERFGGPSARGLPIPTTLVFETR